MAEKRGKFDYRIDRPEPHIILLLTQIDSLKGELKSGLRMTPQALITLRKSVLVTSTGASTRIEGAKLTDEEVEKIMRGLSMSKFADRDSQEVQGYLETLQTIFEQYKELPFRESLVLSLHQQTLQYSTKDDLHRGSYKKKENTVGVVGPEGKVVRILFETTRAFLAPKETHELLDWTRVAFEKQRFHPLLIIANFIIEFLKIHPFEDGNGRLSRLLTNLLLLQNGYAFAEYVSHEQIIEKRKDEYYLALRKSQETFHAQGETIAPWLNFFLSVIKTQAEKAVAYLSEQGIEDRLSVKQLEVLNYLERVQEASPSDIVKATGIALGTVRQALQRLVAVGRVGRMGQGRGTRYVRI